MDKTLLRKYITEVIKSQALLESPVSDAFELFVAKSINKVARNIQATRPPAATQLPDVYVKVLDVGDTFVEVKMGHRDNLANPRVFFDGSKWQSTYTTPVAKFALEMLNSSKEAKKFVSDIKKFTGRKKVKLPTTKGGLNDPDAVSLVEMLEFVESRGNRWVAMQPDVDIGDLVTRHYTEGKTAAAHYLQAGDDFYLIGKKDPLKLNKANGGKIPKLGGTGDFRVRVATRSAFYEIQIEAKIKHFKPPSSSFSALGDTQKTNPFVAIAEEPLKIKKVAARGEKVRLKKKKK